jgi:hypothetical protein
MVCNLRFRNQTRKKATSVRRIGQLLINALAGEVESTPNSLGRCPVTKTREPKEHCFPKTKRKGAGIVSD